VGGIYGGKGGVRGENLYCKVPIYMYTWMYVYLYMSNITLYIWGVYIKDGEEFVERTCIALCLYICIHIYLFVCMCIYVYRSILIGGR